jgi:hypothetical protein
VEWEWGLGLILVEEKQETKKLKHLRETKEFYFAPSRNTFSVNQGWKLK